MLKQKLLHIIFFNLILLVYSYNILAQDIKKDITIVKAYQPVVQDFSKINLMPVFADTATLVPSFQYSIQSQKANVDFKPRPVPLAKMAPETVPTLLNNFITMGIGNPWSPLVDAGFSTGRSKQTNVGLYLHHESAKGKVFIENTKNKIDAPFSQSYIDLYGRRIFKKSVLTGNLNYNSERFNYYGITNASRELYRPDSMIQHFQTGKFKINFYSLNTDSNRLIYSANSNFIYFTDKNNHNITSVQFNAEAGKMFKEFYIGSNVDYKTFVSGGTNDSSYNSLFTWRPYLVKSKNEWQLKAGLNITSDKNDSATTLYVFPFVSFEFVILPRVLKAYLSYDGWVESNNYYHLTLSNPYIKPGTFGQTTSCNASVTATLSGSLSNEITYSLTGNYQQIKNKMFFVNLVDSPFYNKFIPVYDNVELMQFFLDIDYKMNRKLNLKIQSNYKHFSMLKQKQPWGIPLFELKGVLQYNMHDKIFSNSTVGFLSNRYAIQPLTGESKSLNAIFYLNQKIEYRYTSKFYVFVEVKNLTATRYHYWSQYNHYRFQFMGGFTYLF